MIHSPFNYWLFFSLISSKFLVLCSSIFRDYPLFLYQESPSVHWKHCCMMMVVYPSAAANSPLRNHQHKGRNKESVPLTHADTIPSHSHPAHSSIPYQNLGFWDIPGRPVHCSYRLFIVVIPPSCLINEHSQLGHTLLSGPLHRHSQRIIMLHYLIAFLYSSVLMASTVEGVELGTSNIITGGTCCKCTMLSQKVTYLFCDWLKYRFKSAYGQS